MEYENHREVRNQAFRRTLARIFRHLLTCLVVPPVGALILAMWYPSVRDSIGIIIIAGYWGFICMYMFLYVIVGLFAYAFNGAVDREETRLYKNRSDH